MVEYSYAVIFASEALSMMVAIYFGESVIANEVLRMTKGRSMGWGFVALGFGMSFGVATIMFGYISARMNPAVALAQLILGEINGVTFIVAVCGEVLGAFVGAVLVWIHFIPFFKVSVLPAPDTIDQMLVGEQGTTATAVSLSSYNTLEQDRAAREKGISSIESTWNDIKFYLKEDQSTHLLSNEELIEKALGHDAMTVPSSAGRDNGQSAVEEQLRRRSAQVCDVHQRLKDIDLKEYKKMLFAKTKSEEASSKKANFEKLYKASVIADQNAKLSIFATRPALYSPFFNFLCEFLCTTSLVFALLMILERANQLTPNQANLYDAQLGLTVGFFVFLLILGLGGPTALAANPARDFGPRLAHFLLPIHGKGPSEFYYAWIPILAGFAGGCAAAGLYAAVQTMNQSNL